jgi:hypothetical protein
VEVTATAEAEGKAHGKSGEHTECATLSEVMEAEGMNDNGENVVLLVRGCPKMVRELTFCC